MPRSRNAAMSAIAPSADCTTLTATRSASPAASTSSPAATSRTVTPRFSCAANGKVTLVNSFATVTTRVPSGTLAATSPTSWDTLAPLATVSVGTPTSRAHPARAAATCRS